MRLIKIWSIIISPPYSPSSNLTFSLELPYVSNLHRNAKKIATSLVIRHMNTHTYIQRIFPAVILVEKYYSQTRYELISDDMIYFLPTL